VALLTRFLSINKAIIDTRKDTFRLVLRTGISHAEHSLEVGEKICKLYEEMESLLTFWEERRIWLETVKDYLLNR
jgi:hypothetical protein